MLLLGLLRHFPLLMMVVLPSVFFWMILSEETKAAAGIGLATGAILFLLTVIIHLAKKE